MSKFLVCYFILILMFYFYVDKKIVLCRLNKNLQLKYFSKTREYAIFNNNITT